MIQCDKVAINDVSFCWCAVIEFLVKENNSAANILIDFVTFVEIPAWGPVV
jgi:hypothetical protein